MEPGLPYIEARTLQSRLEPEVRPWRVGAMLFTLFASLAVALAAMALRMPRVPSAAPPESHPLRKVARPGGAANPGMRAMCSRGTRGGPSVGTRLACEPRGAMDHG